MEPAGGAYVITPNDDEDLKERIRAITIGGEAGTISYVGWDGNTYSTASLPVGDYAIYAKRILATGTSATGITGWA